MKAFHDFVESKPPISEWSHEELTEGAKLLSLTFLEDTGWKLGDDFVTRNGVRVTAFKDAGGNVVLVGFEGSYSEDEDTMPPMDISPEARMRVRKLLLEYLQEHEDEHTVRFDVISVLFQPENKASARHMNGYMEVKIG